MIDRDFKEQVRERVDIVELIQAYVPLQRAGANFKACCPFHQEKTPSFHVSPDRQSYHCFGCGVHGDIFSFVMEQEAMDFVEALRFLADRAGLQMPERQAPRRPRAPADGPPDVYHDVPPEPSGPDRTTLYQLHDKLAEWYTAQLYSPAGKEALDYLYGRGLDDDWIREFRLGYAPDSFEATMNWGRDHGFPAPVMIAGGCLTQREPDHPQSRVYDRWRHRVMFPICNSSGRVVGFSGRQLREEERGGKYVNSPETAIFHKSRILYGLHLARKPIRDSGYALLCEGQMDVIACHVAGLSNAVAPQGTAFTESQARLLKRYTERLMICFDGDSAGTKAARGSLEAFLPAGLVARVISLGPGEDPDSIVRGQGVEALRARVAAAEDFFIWLLDREMAGRNLRDAAVKDEIVANFVTAVARLPSELMRSEYCGMAAVRLGISHRAVAQKVKAARARSIRQSRFREHGDDGEEAMPSPQSNRRRQLEPVETVELTLLDLALHHERCARRLLDELPSEHISHSAIGHALNNVLAMTAQGEWNAAGRLLVEDLTERPEPLVSRILHRSAHASLDDERAEQACTDSLATLQRLRREAELAVLQQRLKNAADSAERRELFGRIVALQRPQSSASAS